MGYIYAVGTLSTEEWLHDVYFTLLNPQPAGVQLKAGHCCLCYESVQFSVTTQPSLISHIYPQSVWSRSAASIKHCVPAQSVICLCVSKLGGELVYSRSAC